MTKPIPQLRASDRVYTLLRRKRPKILVGISTKTGIQAAPAKALLNTGIYRLFDEFWVDSVGELDTSRNNIFDHFINKTDCDYLMWLDDDVVLFPTIKNLIDSVAEYPYDLLSPVCFTTSESTPFCGIYHWMEGDRIQTWSVEDWISTRNKLWSEGKKPIVEGVDLVGGGCYLIHRRVVQASMDHDKEWFKWFWRDSMDRPRRGEDLYHFLRLKELGFKFAVQLDVECGHMKPFDIRVVMQMFYARPIPPMVLCEHCGKEGFLKIHLGMKDKSVVHMCPECKRPTPVFRACIKWLKKRDISTKKEEK